MMYPILNIIQVIGVLTSVQQESVAKSNSEGFTSTKEGCIQFIDYGSSVNCNPPLN